MKYGKRLLESLNECLSGSPDGPAFAIVRHSERGPITDPERALEVPLTAEGEAAAEELGAGLPAGYRLVLASSPVERCRVTAVRIGAGYETAGGEVEFRGINDDLGGPYVIDPTAVALQAEVMGQNFMDAWRRGRLDRSIIRPIHEACESQTGVVRRHAAAASARELHILVSHDWNVMTVREHMLGLNWERFGWVDFLDGIVMRRDGGSWAMWTCGMRFPGIEMADDGPCHRPETVTVEPEE